MLKTIMSLDSTRFAISKNEVLWPFIEPNNLESEGSNADFRDLKS